MSPQAQAKLDGWHAGSHHLELSGYAVLSEPPAADPTQDKVFFVEDMHLLCAIEESTGGYTNMPPDIRARFMMDMRAKGIKADRLAWWHQHPVLSWSGTDVNTMRQRVHELGLPDKLCAFSFVLTPGGIRARWDQANPDIFVDEIKVFVGTPETLALAQAARDEAEALVASRLERDVKIAEAARQALGDKPAVIAPQVSWKRPAPQQFLKVEEHNIPNQLLPIWAADVHKVTALQRLVRDLTGVEIVAVPERYVTQSLGEIAIAAVDSMAARKAIWERASQSMTTLLYMDGRMAATSMDLYTVDMMSEKAVSAYPTTLYSDDEADPTPCTARATMFNSFIIAGHMTSLLVAHLNGWRYPYRLYYNTKAWEPLKVYGDSL
jgi:hypothetical protein